MPAHLIHCIKCGTANAPSRAYCEHCWVRLRPGGLAGTAADDYGERNLSRLLVAAVLAVSAVALVGAIVAFGGFLNRGNPIPPAVGAVATDDEPADPTPSGKTPLPIFAQPTADPTPTAPASLAPTATQQPPPVQPTPTAQPSDAVQSPAATPGAPLDGTVGQLSCVDQSFTSAAAGRWTVREARWGRHGAADFLAIVMSAGGPATGALYVEGYLEERDLVAARFGVDAPSSGDKALVLVFNDAVRLTGDFGARPGYGALKEFRFRERNGRQVYLVIGVGGEQCFDMRSPGLESGSGGQVELFVEIKR